MKLDRRRFLQTAPLAATATAAAGGALPSIAEAGVAKDLKDWRAVRSLFNLDPQYVHLALFILASHPKPVREAIDEYRKKLDADPLQTIEHAMFDFAHPETNLAKRAADALAKYLGVSGDDVALTGNTTTGLALIYLGLPLRPGEEILTTEHDHFVHHEAIRLAIERNGATSRKIALFDSHDSISAAELVSRIEKAIRPNTRAVGVTWVHSSSGLKLPIRAIADALARVNQARAQKDRVSLIVDGVHGIGVEDPNLLALGCDAFAAGAHKWLFGPRGTGFVWAKPELWAVMKPSTPSFTSVELFDAWFRAEAPKTPPRASWFSPGGFHAFEHYWATPAAIELHEKIGPARVTERIRALCSQLKEGLAKLPKVTLYTPRSAELSAGLVCFDVKGLRPEEVFKKLLTQKIIGSTTPYRVSYARLAVGVANDERDVEKALRAVAALG